MAWGLDKQVSADTDDAWDRPGDSFYEDGDDLDLGNIATRLYTGMRFQNVDIAQGTTVIRAVLSLRCNSSGNISMTACPIAADDVDDSPTFSEVAKPSARTPTDAQVGWTPGDWDYGEWYDSPDIKAVVQEILDRPGWAANQDLSILILGNDVSNNYRVATGHNYGSEHAPKLSITYYTDPVNHLGGATDVASRDSITLVVVA